VGKGPRLHCTNESQRITPDFLFLAAGKGELYERKSKSDGETKGSGGGETREPLKGVQKKGGWGLPSSGR